MYKPQAACTGDVQGISISVNLPLLQISVNAGKPVSGGHGLHLNGMEKFNLTGFLIRSPQVCVTHRFFTGSSTDLGASFLTQPRAPSSRSRTLHVCSITLLIHEMTVMPW